MKNIPVKILGLMFTILFCAGSMAHSQYCASPANESIAWPDDLNTVAVIAGDDGVWMYIPTHAADEGNQCFSVKGANSYLAAPQLNVSNAITIEFWMKADAKNAMDSFQGLVTSDYYGIEISKGFQSNMGINFYATSSQGSSWGMISEANGGGMAVSAAEWHHIAGTYNGASLQLYIDGQPAGKPCSYSGTISTASSTNSYIAFGSEDGRASSPDCIGSRYFNGLLDEISIYNRALRPCEIEAIYNAGISAKYLPQPGF